MGIIRNILCKLAFRRRDRLESAITVYQKELEARKPPAGLERGEEAIKNALGLLDLAKAALKNCDIDKGWKCFHGAQRAELFALDPDGLQARIKVLREEASKLNTWRRDAIYELLGTSKHPLNVQDKYTVYTAELIRDEHFNNQAYKATLMGDLNFGLVVILVLCLSILFCLVENNVIGTTTTEVSLFYSVAIFGLFGAIVSAIIKQMDMTAKSSTIPETVTALRVTLLRIFGGSAFAIALYIFLKADIVSELFNQEITKALENPTPYMIYTISFCAGFTERLILRAVQSVTGDKK